MTCRSWVYRLKVSRGISCNAVNVYTEKICNGYMGFRWTCVQTVSTRIKKWILKDMCFEASRLKKECNSLKYK